MAFGISIFHQVNQEFHCSHHFPSFGTSDLLEKENPSMEMREALFHCERTAVSFRFVMEKCFLTIEKAKEGCKLSGLSLLFLCNSKFLQLMPSMCVYSCLWCPNMYCSSSLCASGLLCFASDSLLWLCISRPLLCRFVSCSASLPLRVRLLLWFSCSAILL